MPRSAQLRLDVALACARRDYDAAERSWQEGFRLIESSTSGRSREWMKEASLEWRQQILERRVQDITVSSNADECHSIWGLLQPAHCRACSAWTGGNPVTTQQKNNNQKKKPPAFADGL